ncbi:MAG TPA: hypothetical protein VGX71_13705 [Pseudaminobacter sp.]|nr:hypothetical protein [Pseudaminobacter sp.]
MTLVPSEPSRGNTNAQKKFTLTVRVLPDGKPIELDGRQAWAMLNLLRAGKSGCTPIDTPGPRWSAYVLKLRRAGFSIETVHESHGGPFPGHHAKYFLRSEIVIVDDKELAA